MNVERCNRNIVGPTAGRAAWSYPAAPGQRPGLQNQRPVGPTAGRASLPYPLSPVSARACMSEIALRRPIISVASWLMSARLIWVV